MLALLVLSLTSCSDAGDLLNLAFDSPSRKPIERARLGINNFFVDREFGSIEEQFLEIRDKLGIRSVRILIAWTDGFQATPTSAPVYGFFDDILTSIPPGMDVVVVLAHTPSWMTNPSNWVQDNPRLTWVERFLRPTVRRYGRLPGVVGFEIWNEPDVLQVPSDAALELENPDNYFEMLRFASRAVRTEAPDRLIVGAATTSIQQNFPTTLRYNQRLKELGAEALIDVWAFHYYSTSFESVVTTNGVADFLNSLSTSIWLTESGENGPNSQLAYVETAWPFLRDEIPGLDRIYYYQFGETVLPVENNFGLRTTDPEFPISDLYIHLSTPAAEPAQ
jgi:hypothetical protein